jgi:hypothetical protein
VTRTFYSWVLAGAVAVLLAAAFMPLPQNERHRSTINVVRDGGREEVFVIQWPQDRLDPPRSRDGLVTGTGSALLAAGTAVASAELFRLRDVGGNVIGLASRGTSSRTTGDGQLVQGSDWTLFVPSRGTLFLTQVNARDVAVWPSPEGALIAAVDRAGWWGGDKVRRITAGPEREGTGRVTGGADEFAGLSGNYDEDWTLEQVMPNGVTRGRITLTTRVMTAP